MGLRYFTNAQATTLTQACTVNDTNINVASVSGFPISYPYTLVIDRDTTSEEVVSVTNASGNVLTVVRGYDATTAFSHTVGATVAHGISAIDPREANQHVNATSGVHGLSGSLVGTTDAQTLTNKTLGPTNVITGLTANRLLQSDNTGKMVASTLALPGSPVVGTTDTQTLTGKTLTSPTINGGTQNSPTITNPTINTPPTNVANPTGSLVMFAGPTAPSGWLKCDGSAVSRSTFSALFAVIGTTYGTGDGTTTFNLPNLVNRFPVGAGSNTLGSSGGSNTISAGNLPAHTHGAGTLATSSAGAHTHDLDVTSSSGGGGSAVRGQTSPITVSGATESAGAHTHNITGSTDSGSGLNNTAYWQPYVAVNYIIKS